MDEVPYRISHSADYLILYVCLATIRVTYSIRSARGPVTTIALNRPECRNALDREVLAELNAAVKEISVDRGCRIVILRGAGDTFCAPLMT
jgi:enoyl-CoA hydratase/carnithine racemase